MRIMGRMGMMKLIMLMLLAVMMVMGSACASRRLRETDPKTGIVRDYREHSFASIGKQSKFVLGKSTKTGAISLSIGETSTDPDEDAIDAVGARLEKLTEAAVRGAVKGGVSAVVPVPTLKP